MSSTDGDCNAVEPRRQRQDLVQLKLIAGSLARRPARPAATLVAVVAAMCLAAEAPATLPLIVVLAVVWRRRHR
jgi:hypothetical protein